MKMIKFVRFGKQKLKIIMMKIRIIIKLDTIGITQGNIEMVAIEYEI